MSICDGTIKTLKSPLGKGPRSPVSLSSGPERTTAVLVFACLDFVTHLCLHLLSPPVSNYLVD